MNHVPGVYDFFQRLNVSQGIQKYHVFSSDITSLNCDNTIRRIGRLVFLMDICKDRTGTILRNIQYHLIVYNHVIMVSHIPYIAWCTMKFSQTSIPSNPLIGIDTPIMYK